jgi:hypothetical protein
LGNILLSSINGVERIIACVAVLLVSACSSQPQKTSTAPRKSQASAINKASFDIRGNVLALPNTVKNIESLLPEEVSDGGPWIDPFDNLQADQFHVWQSYNVHRARTLKIEVKKMKDIKEAKRAISYERSNMANHASKDGPRTVTGMARPVEDIAGECLSFPIEQYEVQPMPMRGADLSNLYRVSGVRMYCRVANVGISIQWQGMDYTTPRVYSRGKGLGYEASQRQAIGIMKTIVTSLTPGP